MTERNEEKNQSNTFLVGAGAPASTLGEVGNMYYDTTDLLLYGPKTSTGWGSGVTTARAVQPAGPSVYGSFGTTGTLAAGSKGISSVVQNSTGNYTVNFSTPFPDTHYVPVASPQTNGLTAVCTGATGSLGIITSNSSGTATNCAVDFAIFGS